jgi:hypothetical protein
VLLHEIDKSHFSLSTKYADSNQYSVDLYFFFNQQSEIDTHLNVLHIDLNTNYNTATSTSAALSTMMSTYSRSSWHFTSPTGVKPDLHHALLSKNLGGGVAYVGVICSSTYGFGLSASLSGSYRSMGNGVVWDMNVVSLLGMMDEISNHLYAFFPHLLTT